MRRPPEERQRFVLEACSDDKMLPAEVESLLSSLKSADSFMETPAVAQVPDVIEDEHKKVEAGKCFGHYEIIKQIGAGGMGEVYLAKDKKLDRKVAVKILNQRFSQHDSNLQRFIREAKSASALNHPNILVIHEIGETDGTHYIVSEFVTGKTLRDIFKDKTLKLSEALDISIQIANALCTAHEARLVHRDIKPENIVGNRQKALDFLNRPSDRDLFELALIYTSLDDFDKAFEVINESFDRGPQNELAPIPLIPDDNPSISFEIFADSSRVQKSPSTKSDYLKESSSQVCC